jgi:hypothetical protein
LRRAGAPIALQSNRSVVSKIFFRAPPAEADGAWKKQAVDER